MAMHCRVEATLTGNTDGTWSITGAVISHKDGDVCESPLGAQLFPTEDDGRTWLQLLGKAVGARDVSIVVRRPQRRRAGERTFGSSSQPAR